MIREGVRTEKIFDEIKDDYLNSTLSMSELSEKYGISRNRLFKECKKIRVEYGLKQRPLVHIRRGE